MPYSKKFRMVQNFSFFADRLGAAKKKMNHKILNGCRNSDIIHAAKLYS